MRYYDLILDTILNANCPDGDFNCLAVNANDINELTESELSSFVVVGIQFIITAPIMEGNAYLTHKKTSDIPAITNLLKQSNKWTERNE